jgi:hypothetical protein
MKTRPRSKIRASEKIAADDVTLTEPYSFRLPTVGQRDPHFGLSRSGWNELILPRAANHQRPEIDSFVRLKPGTVRGARFILYKSARAFFEKLATREGGK